MLRYSKSAHKSEGVSAAPLAQDSTSHNMAKWAWWYLAKGWILSSWTSPPTFLIMILGSFPGKWRVGLALLTKPALDDALESISSKLTRKWLSSTTSEQILAAFLQLLFQYSKREKLPFCRSCEGLGAVSHL